MSRTPEVDVLCVYIRERFTPVFTALPFNVRHLLLSHLLKYLAETIRLVSASLPPDPPAGAGPGAA